MDRFFARLFIKNYEDTESPEVREAYGKMAGIVGICSNALLCAAKIGAGLVAGSIAIIADGINNLADASSSVITLMGFKLAAKPEDKEHPYGHARIEYLTGIFVSVAIIIVGVSLLRSSIEKIIEPEMPDLSAVTILILVLAIAIKLWQTFLNVAVGRRIDSLTLKATAVDSRNDVISTCCVLAGTLICKYGGIVVDGWLGLLVAVFIIWSGIQLIRETSSPLLGEGPDEEIVKEIIGITKKYDGVLGIHDLVVHNYGPGKVFASLHLEVDAKGDIMATHDMVDLVEREINEKLRIEAVVHMDPIYVDDPVIEKLRKELEDIISDIDGVESFHDLRAVSGPTHTNIIFDLVLTPGCRSKKEEIRELVDKKIKGLDPTYFTVISFDTAYTDLNREEKRCSTK